jgi:hypothetical protein
MAEPKVMPSEQAAAAPPSLRAQLLATEHWSLLASRSATQSEVLSRITTFLMLLSASIVTLGLVGQATRFNGGFVAVALVLVSLVLTVGALTQLRIGNAALEDLAHVVGMNRLRAAYVRLDPGIEAHLVSSPHDDHIGLWRTYNPLGGPRTFSGPLASTGAFIVFVNAVLAGVLAGLVLLAFHAPVLATAVLGAVCGLAYIGLSVGSGFRSYKRWRDRYVPKFPGTDNDLGGLR